MTKTPRCPAAPGARDRTAPVSRPGRSHDQGTGTRWMLRRRRELFRRAMACDDAAMRECLERMLAADEHDGLSPDGSTSCADPARERPGSLTAWPHSSATGSRLA